MKGAAEKQRVAAQGPEGGAGATASMKGAAEKQRVYMDSASPNGREMPQ